MDTILLVARLALAAVFVVAGVAKLLDLPGSRRAMGEFGVPAQYTRYAGVALPVAELVIAILLVPRVTAWWGGLGALLLLIAFLAGIGNVMREGRAPDCHCFGQVHSEPVSWRTLARSGVLALIALFIVVQGPSGAGPSIGGWWNGLTEATHVALALGLLATALFGAQGWQLYRMMRRNGDLLARLDALEIAIAENKTAVANATAKDEPRLGLPANSVAPVFTLKDTTGEEHSLASLRSGRKPVILIFIDEKCRPCVELLPEIGRWQRELDDRLTIAVIGHGSADLLSRKTRPYGVAPPLVQDEWEVSERFNSLPTPSAVVISPNGLIEESGIAGTQAIRNLLGRRENAPPPAPLPERPEPPAQIPVGEPSPSLSLPDLEGATVSLEEFKGRSTVALFWNPQCGYCSRMLDDLKALESNRPDDAPDLLVISRGSVEDNVAQGIASRVVLDNEFEAGRGFGSTGTPSAVLIDAEGKVASPVVVGAPAVLELARGTPPGNV